MKIRLPTPRKRTAKPGLEQPNMPNLTVFLAVIPHGKDLKKLAEEVETSTPLHR